MGHDHPDERHPGLRTGVAESHTVSDDGKVYTFKLQ